MQADKAQITRLLKTARGQLDGILKMVEEDRYCIDISNQLMATQSILSRTNAEVLKAHMNCCVRQALESGDAREAEAKLEELSALLEKLVKK
ncbi:MAG: metal-sensing transcriptional repressor [Candidatus Onthomonas sp.]